MEKEYHLSCLICSNPKLKDLELQEEILRQKKLDYVLLVAQIF